MALPVAQDTASTGAVHRSRPSSVCSDRSHAKGQVPRPDLFGPSFQCKPFYINVSPRKSPSMPWSRGASQDPDLVGEDFERRKAAAKALAGEADEQLGGIESSTGEPHPSHNLSTTCHSNHLHQLKCSVEGLQECLWSINSVSNSK